MMVGILQPWALGLVREATQTRDLCLHEVGAYLHLQISRCDDITDCLLDTQELQNVAPTGSFSYFLVSGLIKIKRDQLKQIMCHFCLFPFRKSVNFMFCCLHTASCS